MPFLSKVSNIVQNIFCLYDVTGFTQLWHSIPVAAKCILYDITNFTQKLHSIPVAAKCITAHCTRTDTASETPAKTHFVLA